MKELTYTTRFRKDLRRERRSDPDVETTLRDVLALLLEGKVLPPKLKDHALSGAWQDCRDCHLKPDLVLIYRTSATEVTLMRLGSHSELF
jgi:mRNA interferase YafQ